MSDFKRLIDLVDRLTASGKKAEHVSCSETHEISDGVYAIVEQLKQSQPKWVSVEDEEPVNGEKYWHTHIKDDGTFTPVYRGVYTAAFNLMKTDSHSTMAFTHFALSKPPQPPGERDELLG